ncbi:MAG: cytochrome C class I [Bacteroidetes bacterium]|nr:MAG: cytochrome C class I [Bacteroidota bacterium]
MKNYLVILLIVCAASSAFQVPEQPDGKKLYETHCLRCHGADGSKSFFGSGKLIQSRLNDETVALIIRNGKRIMPSFKKTLTEPEIKALLTYIKSFRK